MVTSMGETRALRVILAKPRGFCAGVVRAIDIVEQALRLYGAPVYVRHEIVHNKHVVASLRARGAIFVDDVEEIPHGALTVFSAHGVSRLVEQGAAARDLDVIDATCPLVHKVHAEGRRYAERGYDVVLIGHEGHAEVEGTRGQIGGRLHVVGTRRDIDRIEVSDPSRVAYVTQTTLSLFDTMDVISALKQRFPAAVGQQTKDICYATQNRQNAVVELAREAQLILVVGSANSSNSNRLREIAEATGVAAHLIDSAGDLDPSWLEGVHTLGLTAGASAPESIVLDTIETLGELRAVSIETMPGVEEAVQFKLPARVAEAALRDG
jgi:4-hydroxy-3-methylbut-2-enyl diphosphate reductase